MSDWKTEMADILSAGRAPTADELEEALAGALTERKALAAELAKTVAANKAGMEVVQDMSVWLARLATAYITCDGEKLLETMDEFVKQRVRVSVENAAVH